MQTISADIKSGTFRKAYLIYGDEPYLVKQYRDNLVRALVQSGDTMNYTRFDGKIEDENAVIALAGTYPFMAEHRVILLDDSRAFKTAGHEALAKCLLEMPDTTCMIFAESEADKRSKLYKAVVKVGHAAECHIPDAGQLLQWVGILLKKGGKKITRKDAAYFLSIMPDNMSAIRQETDKLISYTGDRDIVTKQDIEAICCAHTENQIFKMVQAIAEKQRPEAMRLYRDLVEVREKPARILYQINRKFGELLAMWDEVKAGKSYYEIAREAGLRDFVAKKDAQLCRRFDKKTIERAVQYGTDMEQSVKTGRIHVTHAVELMILTFTA